MTEEKITRMEKEVTKVGMSLVINVWDLTETLGIESGDTLVLDLIKIKRRKK